MAYKRLSDAMSGKTPAPAPAKPKPATNAQYSGGGASEYAGPKSSVSARDAYARAMNSGDRKAAAAAKAQMDAEEAAANIAAKLKKPTK